MVNCHKKEASQNKSEKGVREGVNSDDKTLLLLLIKAKSFKRKRWQKDVASENDVTLHIHNSVNG